MGQASSLPLARRAKFAVTDFGLRPKAGWKPAPLKARSAHRYSLSTGRCASPAKQCLNTSWPVTTLTLLSIVSPRPYTPLVPLQVGLYGLNGHAIHGKLLPHHPRARLAAVAGVPRDHPVARQVVDAGGRWHGSLDALLADDVQLVSLCSPCRAEQAGHALAALRADKHVYAEKPAALDEADLDAIVAGAADHGVIFHEMAHTSFDPPYARIKRELAEGNWGEVVQVVAQKSYPWRDSRPPNETDDGGLVRQVGVHAVRMIEHSTGLRVRHVHCRHTRLGNPTLDAAAGPPSTAGTSGGGGGAFMASVWMLTLDTGALAAVTANYLNPGNTGGHGYETLQIFTNQGLLQTHPDASISLYHRGADFEHIPPAEDGADDYFELVLDHILDGKPFPLTLDAELHPTRIVLRAWHDAMAHPVKL